MPLIPGKQVGVIVLADISGYTAFLADVQTAHRNDAFADGQIPAAYGLMSTLLEGIASKIDPPLSLVKFEGDAAFAVGSADSVPRGHEMVRCLDACYAGFRDLLAEAESVWTCTCEACSRKSALDLKFIVHFGDYFVQRFGDHVDVLGPSINVAHRLLKNSASERLGSVAYALYSQDAAKGLSIPLNGSESFSESIDGMDPVVVHAVAFGNS